jgi:hypothetical protein
MRARAILWIMLATLCSLTLIGADTSPFAAPNVVVYPLTGTAGTPPEAGGNIALLLSSKLSELGGLVLKPYTPGTERPQYLTAAIAQNDDYYLTGYLTPVGNDISLIIQVVSTQSGSVIFSTSSIVQTYADVVAQADPLRDAILHHAGRGFPTVSQLARTTTPAPLASSGSVNLTRALGRHSHESPTPSATPSALASPTPGASGATVAVAPTAAPSTTPKAVAKHLSTRRATASPTATAVATRTSAPTPTPTATATAAPTSTPQAAPQPPATAISPGATKVASLGPVPSGLVADIDGDAPPDERAHAQSVLAQDLQKAGLKGEILHVSSTDAARNSVALCAANVGTAAFFIGTLSNGSDGTLQFSVTAQGCNGTTAAQTQSTQRISGRGGAMAAIDRAASADAVALSAPIAQLAAPKP